MPHVPSGRGWAPAQLLVPAPERRRPRHSGSSGRVTVLSLWGWDMGAWWAQSWAAPRAWVLLGRSRRVTPSPRPVPAVGRGLCSQSLQLRPSLPVGSSHRAASMQAEGVKGFRPLLWERLAQASADAQGHKELLQCRREQWAELTEAVRQQAEAKKLLRLRIQLFLRRWEHLQEQTALSTRRNKFTSWLGRGKAARAEETKPSLLEEMVAARLDEQLATWRSKITSWLGRLSLILVVLMVAIFFLVLLKRDILNWFLPPKLAVALGSRPARPRFF